MTRVPEVIRGWLGWCPQRSAPKTRIPSGPVEPCRVSARPAPAPAAPPAATAAPSGSHPVYQENILLVLVLVAGLFCLVDLRMLALAGVFSALLVYHDAGTMHAGEKFEEDSLFGDVVAWRPLTWAACVLVIPLIFLAIYVFSRKEIFEANT